MILILLVLIQRSFRAICFAAPTNIISLYLTCRPSKPLTLIVVIIDAILPKVLIKCSLLFEYLVFVIHYLIHIQLSCHIILYSLILIFLLKLTFRIFKGFCHFLILISGFVVLANLPGRYASLYLTLYGCVNYLSILHWLLDLVQLVC